MDRINMDRIPDDLLDELKDDIRTEYGSDWRKEWDAMRRVDQIEAAEEYLNRKHPIQLWMERNTTVWIPTVLGIGLAVGILWGAR